MAWPTCAPVGWALKDGAKVQGWQKSDSGIVGLWGDNGGLGRIMGDIGEELRCVEGCKKEGTHPDFSENRGGWGNKKATASEVDAVAKKYNITTNISALVRGTYQPS